MASIKVSSWSGIIHNVPRICEAGQRPVWVKRSETAYSLLCALSPTSRPFNGVRSGFFIYTLKKIAKTTETIFYVSFMKLDISAIL